jgi:hypothetical protein
MSYEMIVGLQIKNDTEYTKYREAMKPILKIKRKWMNSLVILNME